MENKDETTQTEAVTTPAAPATSGGEVNASAVESGTLPVQEKGGNGSTENAVPPGDTGKDWASEYKRIEKRYKDLERKLNTQGAERNEFQKRAETQEKMLKEIAEQMRQLHQQETYDPDQFMESFRQKGPKYFEETLEQYKERLLSEPNGRIEALEARLNERIMRDAVKDRMADTANYPDFKVLEEDMAKLYTENKALFDGQYPDIEEKIDALYQAAKLQRAPEAIKKAEAIGRHSAEQELAREAHASVAGGGRTTSPASVDPNTLSAAELRRYFESKGMVDNG